VIWNLHRRVSNPGPCLFCSGSHGIDIFQPTGKAEQLTPWLHSSAHHDLAACIAMPGFSEPRIGPVKQSCGYEINDTTLFSNTSLPSQ